MEWARSCFRSNWRLFRNSDRPREGRYFFAPPGTPHYPGLHNLWSRDWVSDDGYEEAARGEWAGEREWDRGDVPAVLPLAVLVGSADCIKDGDDPLNPDEEPDCANDGRLYPPACYKPDLTFEGRTNIWDCGFAYHCARILETQYDELDEAAGMVEQLLEDDTTTTAFPQAGPAFPNAIVAAHGSQFFVFVTGTSNFWQLALQTTTGLTFPENQGLYATTALYEGGADLLLTQMALTNMGAATRVVLIGHSYGGALCYVVAAKLRIANPALKVEILTYGMPKAGDARLVALNDDRKQIHYVAFDDSVPFCPPDTFLLNDIFDVTTPVLRALGLTFQRPRKIFFITEESEIVARTTEPIDLDKLRVIYELFSASIVPPAFQGHAVETYARRLLEACPQVDDDCDEFPIEDAVPASHFLFAFTATWTGHDFEEQTTEWHDDVEQQLVEYWFWGNVGPTGATSVSSLETRPENPNTATITIQALNVPPLPFGTWTFALPWYWWEGGTFVPTKLTDDSSFPDFTITSVLIIPNPDPFPIIDGGQFGDNLPIVFDGGSFV